VPVPPQPVLHAREAAREPEETEERPDLGLGHWEGGRENQRGTAARALK
jgi:hypothetical protein